MIGVSEQKLADDLREMERPDGVIYPPDGWGLCNYLDHLKVIKQRNAWREEVKREGERALAGYSDYEAEIAQILKKLAQVESERDAALDRDWVARPAYDAAMRELWKCQAALKAVSRWMDGLAPDNEPLHDMVDEAIGSGSQLADANSKKATP